MTKKEKFEVWLKAKQSEKPLPPDSHYFEVHDFHCPYFLTTLHHKKDPRLDYMF